jgi:CCR4-NOT transcriptional regulation complex NOT5 subunit
MKVIAVEVAARLGMQTRKAATESRATTGEMTSTKAAAHAGAAAEPAAHMTAAEPAAHVSATAEPAPVCTSTSPATAEPAPVSTSTSTSTSPATACKRVGGHSPGESGRRQQHDHGLT